MIHISLSIYIYIHLERERERYIYTYMYKYIYIYMCVYIYIERESELCLQVCRFAGRLSRAARDGTGAPWLVAGSREREREIYLYIYIYTHISPHMYTQSRRSRPTHSLRRCGGEARHFATSGVSCGACMNNYICLYLSLYLSLSIHIYIYIYIVYIYIYTYIYTHMFTGIGGEVRHDVTSGRFVRAVFKQTCDASPPQGVGAVGPCAHGSNAASV